MERQIPYISVIIPVYNVENYLKRCLDSVLAQTIQNFEVIIVDDGSTDNSKEICYRYSQRDKRIKVISCKNGGPSKARNVGLEHVRAPWVTFIDSDDYVTPKYLENFIKYNNNDPEIQVIQGYFTMGYNGLEDNTLYPSTKYESYVAKEGERSLYIEKNNLLYNWAVWCKIFSTEIIRKNNLKFEESIWCGEDGLFWHNYLCFIKKIIYIEEQGYYYFCPKDFDSVSRNNKHKLNAKEYLILAQNYKHISTVLPQKFKMGYKYAAYMRMYYLKYYFKAISMYENLTIKQRSTIKAIRPRKTYIVLSAKGIMLWIANLLPIRIFRYIYSFIKI